MDEAEILEHLHGSSLHLMEWLKGLESVQALLLQMPTRT